MHIRRFTTDQFSAMRDQWQGLLLQSDCDRLFLSWDWMYSWWTEYGNEDGDELLLLGYYENEELCCIAPLYINSVPIKLPIRRRRVEFLGSRSARESGFRTEYLQCLIGVENAGRVTAILQALFDYISLNVQPDELWLSDLVRQSSSYEVIQKYSIEKGYIFQDKMQSSAYGVDTSGNFEGYLKSLGKNSRLQLYNRRKVLEKLGDFSIEILDSQNFGELFDAFGHFHWERWGKRIPYERHKRFVSQLISYDFVRVEGLSLILDGKIISGSFSLSCCGKCYNFQLGYQDFSDKKISLGMLTLGYDIEYSFRNNGLGYYDLLAGGGKNSNYKERIAVMGSIFQTVHVVTGTLFRTLYKIKDSISKITVSKNSLKK